MIFQKGHLEMSILSWFAFYLVFLYKWYLTSINLYLQYIIASNGRDWDKIREIRLNPQTEYKCYF